MYCNHYRLLTKCVCIATIRNEKQANVFPLIERRISYWYHEQNLKCVAMHKYREQEKNWIKEIILPRGTKGNAGLVSRIYVNPFSLWQYGLSNISRGVTKIMCIDFWPKINIPTQRYIFTYIVNRYSTKSTKSTK